MKKMFEPGDLVCMRDPFTEEPCVSLAGFVLPLEDYWAYKPEEFFVTVRFFAGYEQTVPKCDVVHLPEKGSEIKLWKI